ncbi:sulfotransferase [Phycicoccus endophyticus]|uniref:Sulfotransferase n=1 Tax=Phycicoccus endophyticus TaxID=1690220 RepID=A0A7G9R324_9MICO|nr:sulfotransferase domain-containing protein [Phycicoccus endophyticus]NHI20294.1 sulfotransferase domain-containing protein [Phycicoccus endophyticus]QNN49999.1 sulfotransferase [Phycicoccus endophyticus]GGL28969.1 sulfotransferase [Phycicoccus endophyticus]
MPEPLVDFVVAGQPKSGTTALADFLAQHPQVCISRPKEPEFFATDLMRESDAYYGSPRYLKIRTPQQYARCFAHGEPGQLRGEATAIYGRSREAAGNIAAHNPAAKVILILRNPADFVHSMHMQYVNSAVEDVTDFEEALDLEPARREGRQLPPGVRYPSALFYSDLGRYHDQLARFVDAFPADQLLFLTNDEFRGDNIGVIQRVYRFLGVDDGFVPTVGEVHGSKAPRSARLNRLLNAPAVRNTAHRLLPGSLYVRLSRTAHAVTLRPEQREALDPGTRARLDAMFAEDVAATSELVGVDLVRLWGLGADSA